ncbi:MAG TPA: methyltransferase domain-containing protein [Gaiellaceae bacterium]
MSSCCRPESYGAFFSEKAARRALRRYRKRGLDGLSARIAAVVREHGVRGATVLEIGGGIGALEVELLQAGAARGMNVELSPEYEEAAAELAEELRLDDRLERRIGDFVAEPSVPDADAVVLNRVVCCYPDYDALVGAAAERTRRLLVFSFPRERALVRTAFTLMNLWLRLTRNDFRGFVHPVPAMLDVAERRGLTPVLEHRGFFWQLAALERATQS